MAAIHDQKKIIDMALSTATMASFAIPGAGPVIGAIISVGQLFFDIFCPGAPVDSRDIATTRNDLSNAMDDLKKALVDDLWSARIDTVKDDVLAANKLFMTIWQKLGVVGLDVLSIDDGTGTKQAFVVGSGDADFVSDAELYFNLGDLSGTAPKLDSAANAITLSTDSDVGLDPLQVLHHRTRTTNLYCLIASLSIAYLKAAVLWRWGHDQVLLYQEWLAYNARKSVWMGRTAAYQKQHPVEEPISPLKAGAPVPQQPDWNLWVPSASSPVRQMLDTIEGIFAYSVGDGAGDQVALYRTMSEHWKARPPKVAERIAKLSIQSKNIPIGTVYYYSDSETNDVSFPATSRALAELYLESKAGALIAYEWDYWSQAYGLDGVDESDLKSYGKAIQLWTQARQSVDFSVYTTVQGDTLAAIAAQAVIDSRTNPPIEGYANPDLFPIIFSANRGQLQTLDDVLPDGKVLRVPNLATHTVVAGDTLIGIASRVYGDGESYHVIFNANRDILKDPNVIGVGQVLRIPDLGYSPDSQHTVVKGDTLVSIARDYYGHGDFYQKIYEANRDILKNPNSISPGQKLTIPGLDPVLGSLDWCDTTDFEGMIYSMCDNSLKPRFRSLRDAAVEMFGNPDLSLKIFDLNSKLWNDLSDPNAFPDLTSTNGQMIVPQLSYRALSGESLDAIATNFYGPTLPANCTKVIAKVNGLANGTVLAAGQVLTMVPRYEVELQSSLHFSH